LISSQRVAPLTVSPLISVAIRRPTPITYTGSASRINHCGRILAARNSAANAMPKLRI
jgi:hypothetical protein